MGGLYEKYFGPSLALGIAGLISGSIAWLMGIEYLGYIAVFCFLLSGIVNTDRSESHLKE